MLEYIYVCRHGYRSNWVTPELEKQPGPTGMIRDHSVSMIPVHLAPHGLEQAVELAAFLSDPIQTTPYPTPEMVFSSPYYRCIQTAQPTALSINDTLGVDQGICLDNGIQEWFSPLNPGTGLHPRPRGPDKLAALFPKLLDQEYLSTLYPSRRGENLSEVQDRADLFVEAWTARVEDSGARTVVIFTHAAGVITLGRAFTGDKNLDVSAGAASTSLYRRRSQRAYSEPNSSASRSTTSLQAASTLLDLAGAGQSATPSGVGEWDIVWNGKADYLSNGIEHSWSFRDAEMDNGNVVNDDGDFEPHEAVDELPVGLGAGMERYLRRGRPPLNGPTIEMRGHVIG